MKRKPLLLFDGDCAFCEREAARLLRWTGNAIRKQSFREPGALAPYPSLTEEDCDREMKLIESNDNISGGAKAFFRAFSYGKWTRPFSHVYSIPGFPWISESV